MFPSSLTTTSPAPPSGLLVALPLLWLSAEAVAGPLPLAPPVFACLFAVVGFGFARLARVRFAGAPAGSLTTLDLSTVVKPALVSTGTKPLPSAIAPLTAAAVAHAIRMVSSASSLVDLKACEAGWESEACWRVW